MVLYANTMGDVYVAADVCSEECFISLDSNSLDDLVERSVVFAALVV